MRARVFAMNVFCSVYRFQPCLSPNMNKSLVSMETACVGDLITDGDKKFQKRARRALPLLLRQASAESTSSIRTSRIF